MYQSYKDQKIEKMYRGKIQRWDKSGESAKLGGLIHDAVAIVVGKGISNKNPKRIYTEIVYWLDKLLALHAQKIVKLIEELQAQMDKEFPDEKKEFIKTQIATEEANDQRLQEEDGRGSYQRSQIKNKKL